MSAARPSDAAPTPQSPTLLLAFNFPPLGGGIARMMGEVARRYPAGSLVVSTGQLPDTAVADAQLPQPVHRVGIRATRLRTINGLVWWTARASRLARRIGPAFTWCGELKPAGYPAWWLARRRHIPYGVVLHGTELLLLDAKSDRSRFKRGTAGALLGRAAALVANSRWTADLARRVLERLALAAPPPVHVVPLGTTPQRFRPGLDGTGARTRHGLDGGPWLLTVARLEWHKGIDTVIRALPEIRRAHPGVRYAVAGVGPRRPHLEQIATDAGVADAVRFLGFVPDDELPALYNAVDLYVGASRRVDLLAEGFGISLVEASACGLAVVGGRAAGVPDAVRDGETGLLVDPEVPAAVARAVTELLADAARRKAMGAAGRRAVEAYYNWDRVTADLIRIDAAIRRAPRAAAP